MCGGEGNEAMVAWEVHFYVWWGGGSERLRRREEICVFVYVTYKDRY